MAGRPGENEAMPDVHAKDAARLRSTMKIQASGVP
jgi:hypothetical protein